MDDIEALIREEFLSEAEELLEECERAFVDLEKDPDDDQTINAIFRYAHTLKGSGLAAGFNDFANIAHKFEAILSAIRNQQVRVEADVIDVLLRFTDTLKDYRALLKQDMGATYDASAIEAEADHILAGPDRDQGASPVDGNQTGSEAIRGALTSIDYGDKHILVCDDEESMREVILMSLEPIAAKTSQASDGLEALGKIQEESFDLVITDLKMPNMNGLEFVEKLRGISRTLPVIFISGFAQRDDIAKFLKLGVFDFFEKPYDDDRLVMSVKNALRLKSITDASLSLANLNYKAYVEGVKMAQHTEQGNDEEREASKAKLEQYLDQISELTNRILSPI